MAKRAQKVLHLFQKVIQVLHVYNSDLYSYK